MNALTCENDGEIINVVVAGAVRITCAFVTGELGNLRFAGHGAGRCSERREEILSDGNPPDIPAPIGPARDTPAHQRIIYARFETDDIPIVSIMSDAGCEHMIVAPERRRIIGIIVPEEIVPFWLLRK
jgi:hypothetical protein